jgi:hypothetical protein
MTSAILISGKLIGNVKISETSNGRPMAKALLEVEQWRPVTRGEMKMEVHQFPVLAFSFNAETLRDLRPGAAHNRRTFDRNQVRPWYRCRGPTRAPTGR